MVIYSFPALQVSTAGLATEAKQDSQITLLTNIDAGIPVALGQTTMAASMPVTIASNQSAIPISAASLPLPTGAATETTLAALNTKVTAVDTGAVVVASSALPSGAATSANQTTANSSLSSIDGKVPSNLTVSSTRLLVDNSGVTQPISAAALPLPTGAATAANQTTSNASLASIDAGIPAGLGQTTAANSMPVVLASDQSALLASQSGTWTVQPGNTANTTPWLVQDVRASTATLSNVAASASSISLLASNANRKGVTIFNDSSALLYVKFGTTASTTSYTVQINGGGYYEMPGPNFYTGAIDGIWASATGSARITEMS